jgi:NTE family protein
MELIAMDAASCSLPPSFPATQIDGHSYWYGGLWSNTPLCEVLNCLQKNPGSHTPKPMTRCLVFIVDLFAPGGDSPAVIRGNWDVWALRDRVLFQDKVWYDERSGEGEQNYSSVASSASPVAVASAGSTKADCGAG